LSDTIKAVLLRALGVLRGAYYQDEEPTSWTGQAELDQAKDLLRRTFLMYENKVVDPEDIKTASLFLKEVEAREKDETIFLEWYHELKFSIEFGLTHYTKGNDDQEMLETRKAR